MMLMRGHFGDLCSKGRKEGGKGEIGGVTQKVAAARLGMISAVAKHRREKMKRLGMSGCT